MIDSSTMIPWLIEMIALAFIHLLVGFDRGGEMSFLRWIGIALVVVSLFWAGVRWGMIR